MRIFLFAIALVGCDAAPPNASPDAGDNSSTPDDTPDGSAPAPDLAGSAVSVGGLARVTAGSLNLRSGPGTTNSILDVMPCGATVMVIGGPSGNWWNVTYKMETGWASGSYLVADSAFDPSFCGAATDGGAEVPDVDAIFSRAKLGVGYSYDWGHGSWRSDGTELGACMGTCPNCTHNGSYGADCSGFVAKCWQIPSPSPLTTDLHPYSTYNFFNQTTHWSQVPRASLKPADALVYNANGAGHIMLFESGNDPWGMIWTYEARGCATGIVHNLRVADSSYIAIRREGL
jgi:hypothetical protein